MQSFDLEPKKRPKQARSKATFDAIVEACTRVLPEQGYAGTTTNHIAEEAGVGIASLYEYFPGKDAIIAQVAQRESERYFAEFAAAAQKVWGAPTEDLMRLWLEAICRILEQGKSLLKVFQYEVPYNYELMNHAQIVERLIRFSELLEAGASSVLPIKQTRASMYLIVSLVSSTLSQLVLIPPSDVTREEVIKELAEKLNGWVFGEAYFE